MARSLLAIYDGGRAGAFGLNSRAIPMLKYRVHHGEPFPIEKGDEWIVKMAGFRWATDVEIKSVTPQVIAKSLEERATPRELNELALSEWLQRNGRTRCQSNIDKGGAALCDELISMTPLQLSDEFDLDYAEAMELIAKAIVVRDKETENHG